MKFSLTMEIVAFGSSELDSNSDHMKTEYIKSQNKFSLVVRIDRQKQANVLRDNPVTLAFVYCLWPAHGELVDFPSFSRWASFPNTLSVPTKTTGWISYELSENCPCTFLAKAVRLTAFRQQSQAQLEAHPETSSCILSIQSRLDSKRHHTF